MRKAQAVNSASTANERSVFDAPIAAGRVASGQGTPARPSSVMNSHRLTHVAFPEAPNHAKCSLQDTTPHYGSMGCQTGVRGQKQRLAILHYACPLRVKSGSDGKPVSCPLLPQ